MTDSDMIDELSSAHKGFIGFFRDVMERQIARANAACGYTDDEFAAAISRLFDEPESVLRLSVEHRFAIRQTYEACRTAWIHEGGAVTQHAHITN